MKDILDQIQPTEALVILRKLAESDTSTKKRIAEIAEDLIKDVDIDEICDDVFSTLDIDMLAHQTSNEVAEIERLNRR